MYDHLDTARQHQQSLLDEAAWERFCPPPRLRHTLAALLRRAADRLEPIPFVGTARIASAAAQR